MLLGALTVVCAYLAGALGVHVAYGWLRRSHREAAKHYVLISRDNQLRIEWFVRALLFSSWLKGKPIKLSILDQNSEDDTLPILYRLSKAHSISVRADPASQGDMCFVQSAADDGRTIVIDLRAGDDLGKIPLLL